MFDASVDGEYPEASSQRSCLRDRTVADEKPDASADHLERVEAGERAQAVQSPCEHDREGDLVELRPVPVRVAVHPKVLRESAVIVLRHGEKDEGAKCRVHVAGGDERQHAAHHVSRPDEMISAGVVVALDFSPRDGERCDQRPRVSLVLVGQQDTAAASVEVAAVVRMRRQLHHAGRCLSPLRLVGRELSRRMAETTTASASRSHCVR